MAPPGGQNEIAVIVVQHLQTGPALRAPGGSDSMGSLIPWVSFKVNTDEIVCLSESRDISDGRLFGPLSRYMLALSVVPAVLQFIGFIFLPESPRWLLHSGRTQEAHHVLRRIRGGRSVDVEYESIKRSIEDEEREAGGGEPSQPPPAEWDIPAVISSLLHL